MNITNATVLGTGVVRPQICCQAAYSGFPVTAYDIDDEILKAAYKQLEGLAARYRESPDPGGTT